MEFVGLEGSPTHNLVTVDAVVKPSGGYLEELKDIFDEDLIDFFGKKFPSAPVSPVFPESPAFPVSLPPQMDYLRLSGRERTVIVMLYSVFFSDPVFQCF